MSEQNQYNAQSFLAGIYQDYGDSLQGTELKQAEALRQMEDTQATLHRILTSIDTRQTRARNLEAHNQKRRDEAAAKTTNVAKGTVKRRLTKTARELETIKVGALGDGEEVTESTTT